MADTPDSIYNLKGVPPTARWLASLLWRHADRTDHPFVFPSTYTLAAITGQHATNVRRQLRQLKARGIIEEKHRLVGTRWVRGWVLHAPFWVLEQKSEAISIDDSEHLSPLRASQPSPREHLSPPKRAPQPSASISALPDERAPQPSVSISALQNEHLSPLRASQPSLAENAREHLSPPLRASQPSHASISALQNEHLSPHNLQGTSNEPPVKQQLQPQGRSFEQGRGRAAAAEDENPKRAPRPRRESAAGLTDMLDQAAARRGPGPTVDPTEAVITGVREGRWDGLKGAELGAGVGVKIAQALWRHMCVRMGKPGAPFPLGARTLWAQATSPDFAGTPVTPSVMLRAIEARTVHERRKAQTGGRPAESMPRLWGWILEEPDKWANPKSGMSGEKQRRHEHEERLARVQAVKDKHRAELDNIDDEAERVHREQVLLHEAGLLSAKPLSVAFLRASLGVPKAVTT